MPRVKKGVIKIKTRRNVLRRTKGFRGNLSTKKRAARTAIAHAGIHAFESRRDRKNDFRRLWNVRLNAALRTHGISYSAFIGALKKKGVELDRKILSDIAAHHPEVFAKIVHSVR